MHPFRLLPVLIPSLLAFGACAHSPKPQTAAPAPTAVPASDSAKATAATPATLPPAVPTPVALSAQERYRRILEGDGRGDAGFAVQAALFEKQADEAMRKGFDALLARKLPNDTKSLLAERRADLSPFHGLYGLAIRRGAERQAAAEGDAPTDMSDATQGKDRFTKLLLGMEADGRKGLEAMNMAWANRVDAYLARRPARARTAERALIIKGSAQDDRVLAAAAPGLALAAAVAEDVTERKADKAKSELAAFNDFCARLQTELAVAENAAAHAQACGENLRAAQSAVKAAFGG